MTTSSIYAFNRVTYEVLDEFRNVAEAADKMETNTSVVQRILDGKKTDLDGVGLVEISHPGSKLVRKGKYQ